MAEIPRTDSPPVLTRARIYPPPVGTTWITLLGKWCGYWVHWVGKRSMPCLEDRCPRSRHWKPAYWTGYFPAAIPMYSETEAKKRIGWENVIVPANADAVAIIRDNARRFPLVITAERKPIDKGWTVGRMEEVPDKHNWPEPFSVASVLYRVWGVRPGQDDQECNGIMVDGQLMFPLGENAIPE